MDALCDHWPEDYELYQFGNEKQQFCVFCDDYHINYEIYVRDVFSGEVKRSPHVFACVECAQHVEALLLREWNIGSLAIDAYDSSDGPERFSNSIEDKKNLLLMGLQFTPETFKHYVYLKSTEDRYVANNENNCCYTCGDFNKGHPITGTNSWMTISVPVDTKDTLGLGGKVLICPVCEHYLKDIHTLYESKLQREELYLNVCSSCLETYEITAAEQEYRIKLTSGNLRDPDWQCPACTHKLISRIEEGISPLYDESNGAPRFAPMCRFIQRECYTCLGQSKFDLMLSNIRARHFINVLGKQYFICNECIQANLHIFFQGHNVAHYDQRTIVIFFENGKSYKALRFNESSTYPENFLVRHLESDDLADNVCIAFEDINEFRLSKEHGKE
jgi:hypothetical protein